METKWIYPRWVLNQRTGNTGVMMLQIWPPVVKVLFSSGRDVFSDRYRPLGLQTDHTELIMTWENCTCPWLQIRTWFGYGSIVPKVPLSASPWPLTSEVLWVEWWRKKKNRCRWFYRFSTVVSAASLIIVRWRQEVQELPDSEVMDPTGTCCRGNCTIWFPARLARGAAAGSGFTTEAQSESSNGERLAVIDDVVWFPPAEVLSCDGLSVICLWVTFTEIIARHYWQSY